MLLLTSPALELGGEFCQRAKGFLLWFWRDEDKGLGRQCARPQTQRREKKKEGEKKARTVSLIFIINPRSPCAPSDDNQPFFSFCSAMRRGPTFFCSSRSIPRDSPLFSHGAWDIRACVNIQSFFMNLCSPFAFLLGAMPEALSNPSRAFPSLPLRFFFFNLIPE